MSRPLRVAAVLAVALLALAACGGGDDSDTSRATTPKGGKLVYAALGDSYSSGAGAPPYDLDSLACERSPDAWPRLLGSDSPRIRSVDHRACAGAEVAQLLEPWAARAQAAQIAADPELSVGLVTLTAGGNDAKFGQMMASCYLGDCPSPTDPAFAARLATLAVTLDRQVYPALRHAYPNALIVHVGYPQLVAAHGAPVGCDWLSPADQAAAPVLIEAINSTVRSAAEQAGITYVDISGVLAGHELCSADPWIQPATAKDPLHPSKPAQEAIERAVATALDLSLDERGAG
jgi:lysophospholipase L1-like esterase